MIKAAIIDDGANPERFNIHRNIVIDDDLVITEKNAYDNTELSHADICMSIIELYACMDNVKWYDIKVLKDDTNFQCEIILLGFSEFIQPERCPSASLWIWDGTETEHETNRFNIPSDQLGIYANNETGKELYKRIVSILE